MNFKNRRINDLFSFFIIMISMVFIDGLWLGIMLKRFYAPHIGHLLNDMIAIWPAVIFYVLFGIALNVFVVLPALKNNTGYLDLFLLGFLFGMVTYGTYDLTNQVTIRNWPWSSHRCRYCLGQLLSGGRQFDFNLCDPLFLVESYKLQANPSSICILKTAVPPKVNSPL